MQLADQDSVIPSSGLEADWNALVALSAAAPAAVGCLPDSPASPLHGLYQPLLAIGPTCAVAHLGQSLDGHIATAKGASHYVTGPEDILHNHRMRALFDAVVVGAGTVCHDDPRLTVRLCPGANPVRVVVDTERRLGPDYRVFQDGAAESLLLTATDRANGSAHGAATVIGVSRRGNGLCPAAVREALADRGLARVFIEGGGVTVSRFVEAACLDRLQVTIAPLIIGSGRPGISLPQVDTLSDGLRPRVRRFLLGEDVMFECIFDD
jgi:riboflavin-specific deaminase-like protein